MPLALVRARKAALVAWLLTGALLLPVGPSAALSVGGISPQITVAASDGFSYVHYTKAGWPIAIDVMLLAKDATPPFASDVYVGIISPGGQSTSLLNDPQASGFPFMFEPVIVTGPAVAFRANVILDTDTGDRLAIPHFTGPPGWYMVYGLIVATGRDPGDPKQWVSSSFFPILLTPAADQ